MSTESSQYAYRLGFRFVTKGCSAIDSGQKRRRDAAGSLHRLRDLQQTRSSLADCVPQPCRTGSCRHPFMSMGPNSASGRDLAAIQIQRFVRGWRARVWAVKVVHDRAWRALLLIQAICRGALTRQKIRRGEATKALIGNDQCKARSHEILRDITTRRFKHKRYKTRSPGGYPQQRHERCPERVAWEQSWEKVRLGRSGFRDRVRVWQSISELKRAGGRGRMRITNNEAWVALRDSSGSASAAAILLSNEEYLLGRRLQQRGELREPSKVPPHLSLDLAARHVCRSASHSPSARQAYFRSRARPSSVGTDNCERNRTPKALRGSGSRENVFCCASDLFYDAPRSTTKTLMLAARKS
ncbi:unnamed protein product [Scytosiphon promiscuus]